MNVTPSIFFSRSKKLYLLISLVQLIHLVLVSKFSAYNIVIWFILFGFGYLFFVCVENCFRNKDWPCLNKTVFSVIFFVSFFVTLIYSRLPYFESYLDQGMYLTRKNEELGAGGFYTFITVFFYPASMILAIIELNKKYVYLGALSIILLIDIFILGTRGAPFFVILFHLLFVKKRYSVKFLVPALLVSLLSLVSVFSYQTESRSLTESYNWKNTVTYSRLFDNLPLKDEYIDRDFPESFYVTLYVSQYITHSISEFGYLLNRSSYGLTGTFNYVLDEVCLIAMCDRSEYQKNIRKINDRQGLYQTLYSSLLFDFGYIGLLTIILLVGILIILNSTISLCFLTYISMVVAFSLIDNYIYNAIGLGRFVLFVGIFIFCQ